MILKTAVGSLVPFDCRAGRGAQGERMLTQRVIALSNPFVLILSKGRSMGGFFMKAVQEAPLSLLGGASPHDM